MMYNRIHFFRGALIFFAIIISASSWAQIKPDTILPSAMITPFDISGDDAVNFPLGQASPAGDINGDGMEEMIFNHYAGNEQTPEMTDIIAKSVISFSAGIPGENLVLHGSQTYGIGDYNNDGYDDILDVFQNSIRYGCADGISESSTSINIPYEYADLYFKGDINNDGYSDFLIGEKYDSDTLLVFLGPDSNSFIFPATSLFWHFDMDITIFYIYDYDNDDTTELCISQGSFGGDSRIISFWYYNETTHKLDREHAQGFPCIHDITPHFPTSFTDLNGDGRIDITHVFGAYDSTNTFKFNLEVYFGLDSFPYFDQPMEIMIGNPSRFLYNAGDLNGDVSDDWYSKYDDSTMVVYYGNPDVQSNGVQTTYYDMDDIHLYLPLGQSYGETNSSISMLKTLNYDNDGYDDLYFNYWGIDSNKRFDVIGTGIVRGGLNPDFRNPIIIGKPAGESFQYLSYGRHSHNIGDLNNDGYDDWGILSPAASYLEIFYGGEELNYIPDVTFMLPQTNMTQCFNWTSGDLNGDGWIDIAISNTSHYMVGWGNSFITPRNEIYIFFGQQYCQAVNYYDDADIILKGDFNEFGSSLSIVGDYNADGYDDLVVAGYPHSRKEAFIYFGSDAMSNTPDMVIRYYVGSYAGYFAHPITACGDINADGYDDFTLADSDGDQGRSLIYYGGPDADSLFDQLIINPDTTGNNFGSGTATTEGDFNGDGYPDLFQFSGSSKRIFVYFGGPFFDTNHDFIIDDSLSTNYWSYAYGYINRNSETGRSDIGRSFTLAASYSDTNVYDLRIYSYENSGSGQPEFVLKNRFERPGTTFASGDFNNDGLCEVIVGIPYERNYGNPYGGVAYFYIPSAPFSIAEEPMPEVNSVIVFPNPANNTCTVSYNSTQEAELFIKVVDLMGRPVLTESHPMTMIGNNKFHISTASWPSGVYLLSVQQGNEMSTIKLVKSDR